MQHLRSTIELERALHAHLVMVLTRAMDHARCQGYIGSLKQVFAAGPAALQGLCLLQLFVLSRWLARPQAALWQQLQLKQASLLWAAAAAEAGPGESQCSAVAVALGLPKAELTERVLAG